MVLRATTLDLALLLPNSDLRLLSWRLRLELRESPVGWGRSELRVAELG